MPVSGKRALFLPHPVHYRPGRPASAEFANWFTGNSANFSIGPSVTLPIFLGGTNVARLEAAESRYQQLLKDTSRRFCLAFREVADLLVSIQARAQNS